MADKIEAVLLSQLFPFPDNPFKVNEGIEMDMLVESIKKFGIITPLIVRPVEDGYEIVSGHRRYEAARKAWLEKVPAFVRDMTRNAAVVTLVDSNLQREHLLPSEKAFAYRMKLEAMKRQGCRTDLTSAQ